MAGKQVYRSSFSQISEPGEVFRWGTGTIFIFFIGLLLLANFFSYNETVRGEAIITSGNPPVNLVARQTGKFSSLYFDTGDSINAGEIIAVMENSANEMDVFHLKNQLSEKNTLIPSIETFRFQFSNGMELGSEVQLAFDRFFQAYQTSILESSHGNNQLEQRQIQDQLKIQQKKLALKEQEIQHARSGIGNVEMNLERHKTLFLKGVISKFDLEKVENDFFLKRQHDITLEENLVQLQYEISRIQKNLEILKNSGERETTSQKTSLLLAKQDLENKILQWEERYIIRSPVDGILSFNHVMGKFQNIENGETLFTISPEMAKGFMGKCFVPIANSGKIRPGQDVYLKLQNYPFREWGFIYATVGSVSPVVRAGDQPGYTIYLNIPNLKTSYGKELSFHQDMIGTAEILLEEISLLDRIFFQLRHLLKST